MIPFPRIVEYDNIAPYVPSAQELITTIGNSIFVVPEGVSEICACVISPGVEGGGGGGLSWRNKIPVTPGESLTITIQRNNIQTYGESGIYRGTEKLCVSGNGYSTSPGFGGKTYNAINDGGGNGGFGATSGGAKIGGGAGGYMGAGGAGVASGTGNAGAGGGGGGGNFMYTPFTNAGRGGGTGIIVMGNNGTGGSSSIPNGGAGSGGSSVTYGGGGAYWNYQLEPGPGAVRIIWGTGRSYPSRSEDE